MLLYTRCIGSWRIGCSASRSHLRMRITPIYERVAAADGRLPSSCISNLEAGLPFVRAALDEFRAGIVLGRSLARDSFVWNLLAARHADMDVIGSSASVMALLSRYCIAGRAAGLTRCNAIAVHVPRTPSVCSLEGLYFGKGASGVIMVISETKYKG